MTHEPHIDDDLATELTLFVDGRLPPERHAALDARVARSPALQSEVGRQQAVSQRLREAAADVGAPSSLRARVERNRAPAAQRRGRWRLGRALGLAAAAAAAAVLAVAVVVPVLGPGSPGFPQAASLGARPADAPAPPPARDDPGALAAVQDDVPFPDWGPEFDWQATGRRRDEIDGRTATTVFYENASGDKTAAYTILGGEAIDPPSSAKSTTVGETTYRTVAVGGRRAVTWERDGQTCILSSADTPPGKLLELAGWEGHGGLPS